MALPTINPTNTNAWKNLEHHFSEIKSVHMADLFGKNPKRADQFSLKWKDFYVDYSKNRINDTTFNLLMDLAKECQLAEAIKKYFGGDTINATEGRAVLHTALRESKSGTVNVDGKNVVPEVHAVKAAMRSFSEGVISGTTKGHTGKAFTDVVNIGIGGSDLGPAMVTEALAYYKNHLNVHFVSNVDGDHVHEVLKNINPETTLFVVVSKTFTTQETLSNATTIKKWLVDQLGSEAVASHFAAVSTNLPNIEAFGIHLDNVFPMNDWVGGRFSLWSAVGLSICLAVGPDNFEALLEGAHEMDLHFKNSPFEQNTPVILAMISIWYNNFFDAESEAIIPYTQYLHRFAAYLQQGIMESNGKSVDRNGNPVDYQTGTLIWGEPGTNSQHAFFQLIHQGTKLIPADFIGYKKSLHGDTDHHQKLMANFFAQTEALMTGKSESQVREELADKAKSPKDIDTLTPFKIFEGNKPTNTLLIDRLTPSSLGALIALYEHKIFVQGIIWNIYSYDQWGVELGKQLATTILTDIVSTKIQKHDASTTALLNDFKKSQ